MKSGFTLLEVIIALLAAALISIMSFDFLANTIFLKERIDSSISEDSKRSKAIHLMRFDMMQAIPFKLKDQNFNFLNNVFIGSNEERILTFVALSSSDTAVTNSKLRRIIYRFKDRNLVRTTTLANNENVVISEDILLTNINKLQISFGDSLDDMTDTYPGLNVTENESFPQFIVLNYEINEKKFKQVMGFFR
jgi:type II secretion system protein J